MSSSMTRKTAMQFQRYQLRPADIDSEADFFAVVDEASPGLEETALAKLYVLYFKIHFIIIYYWKLIIYNRIYFQLLYYLLNWPDWSKSNCTDRVQSDSGHQNNDRLFFRRISSHRSSRTCRGALRKLLYDEVVKSFNSTRHNMHSREPKECDRK